jgi:hypothetical protein
MKCPIESSPRTHSLVMGVRALHEISVHETSRLRVRDVASIAVNE